MTGALLACGVPPWFMVAYSSGEQFGGVASEGGEPASSADRSGGASFRLHRGAPALGPGSWRLALSSLARPYRYSPAALLAGWLPLGPISTEPLKDTVRRACAEPWAPHPNYWAVAVDYQTGRRVAFGSDGAPPAQLADAVAASCAIPGFFRAVEIDGRRYVDGGLHSASNLDILEDERLDLVIALNPMSSLHRGSSRMLGERVAYSIRQNSGKRLGSEAGRLRERGTEVLLIQPTVHDLDVMGTNLMSRSRRHEVIEMAVETMTDHLRETALGERLGELPPRTARLGAPSEAEPSGSARFLCAGERRAGASHTLRQLGAQAVDPGGRAILVRSQPVHRGHAPAVTGREPGEVVLRHRRNQVVANTALVFEEKRR